MKADLHPASHILTTEISKLCGGPDRIYPLMKFSGICGNADLHSMVDITFTPFGSLTLIGGVLNVVGSWRVSWFK